MELHTPMDLFTSRLLAFLVILQRAASTSDFPEVIGAVGGSVTFHSEIPAVDAAFWTFGNDPIATVLPGNPKTAFSDDKYRTRFAFSENGLVLTISQLTLEDAGTYSVKIKGRTSSFTLRVYRELLEPMVTCEAQNCSAGSCFFSLRCSAPGAGFGNVSYFWSREELLWDEGPTVLVVNKSSGSEPESLTCTARNPVSSRNVTVPSPGRLCAENAVHSPGPGALSGSGVRIGVVAGIGAAVFLLAFLFAFLWKSKGWRKSQLSKVDVKDAAAVSDYTTVYAEVGPSQQSIPNGINAKPKVAAPEPSSTVYALVKHPEQVDEGKEENASTSILELV